MKAMLANKKEINPIAKCPDYLNTKFFLNKPTDCLKKYV